MRAQQSSAFVEGGAVDRLRVVEVLAHVDVLRTLAGEEHGELGPGSDTRDQVHRGFPCGKRRQLLDEIPGAVAGHSQAVLHQRLLLAVRVFFLLQRRLLENDVGVCAAEAE